MNPSTGMPTAPQMSAGPAVDNSGVDPSQFGNYSDWAKGELAKGFTPEQLQAHLSQNGVKVDQPHSGNWFTHLLPTIGSVALPALGALLAPETGGLSLIAAAGLSGLGAAGGKAAENATEGKGLIDKHVLDEGMLGAAGGAVGGVVGKGLAKGAEALGGAADNIAAKEATQTAAQEGIDNAANTYKDISPQLQKALNAKGSLEHVTNMGYDITDPANLVHVSNTSNDVLNDVLNRALANSGPVDLSHYPDIVKEALAKEGGTLGSYEKVALARGHIGYANTPSAKLLQQLENLGAGVAKTNGDPNELRTLTTKLGQLAQDAKPTIAQATGAIDPQQRAIYNVINDVRGQVKNALYDRPEVADAIKGEMGGLTADGKMGITQQLADHLNGVIDNGTYPQHLLDEISRNIDIGRLGEEGQKVGQIVTSTGGKARAAAEAGLETGPGTPPTGNTMFDMAGLVNPHAGAVKGTLAAAKHVAQNPAILSTLSRIGNLGAKLAPAAGAVVATSPNLQADPVGVDPGMYGGGTNGTMGGNMNMAPTNGAHSYQDLINAMEAQAVLAPSMGGGASSFLAQVAPQLQKNQLAIDAAHAIPTSFANAGGPQGTGGIMSRISGLIPGTAAHTYQQQQQAAAAQLAQALGITPQQAMGLLPQLMQNQGTAGMTGGILSGMSGSLAY